MNKTLEQLKWGYELLKFGCKYIKILCTKQEYKTLFSPFPLNNC